MFPIYMQCRSIYMQCRSIYTVLLFPGTSTVYVVRSDCCYNRSAVVIFVLACFCFITTFV